MQIAMLIIKQKEGVSQFKERLHIIRRKITICQAWGNMKGYRRSILYHPIIT